MVGHAGDGATRLTERIIIRAAEAWDRPAILELNERVEIKTSKLNDARLKDMLDWSTYSRVAEVDGRVVGFIIVMGPASGYDNANLDWFRERVRRFLYVDRIVVAPDTKGIGTMLYEDLFEFAGLLQIPYITCEYNTTPPNEPSRKFHDKLGFTEIGERVIGDGEKRVSMQCLVLEYDD